LITGHDDFVDLNFGPPLPNPEVGRWEPLFQQNVHDDSGGRTPGRKIRDKAIAAPWMEAQMGNGLQG